MPCELGSLAPFTIRGAVAMVFCVSKSSIWHTCTGQMAGSLWAHGFAAKGDNVFCSFSILAYHGMLEALFPPIGVHFLYYWHVVWQLCHNLPDLS